MSKQEFLNQYKKLKTTHRIYEILQVLVLFFCFLLILSIFITNGLLLLIAFLSTGISSFILFIMIKWNEKQKSDNTIQIPSFGEIAKIINFTELRLFNIYFGELPDLPNGLEYNFHAHDSFIDTISDEQFEQVTKQLLLIHEFKQSPLQKTNKEVYTQELNNLLTDFYKLVSNFVTVYAVQDVYKVSLLENGYTQDVFELAKYDSNFANYKKNVLKLRFPVSNIAFNDFKPLETEELLSCYLEHVKEQGTLERNSKYHTLNEFKQEYSRGTFL